MTPPPLGWRSGNRYTLLENGEAYFPAVRAAVDAAAREVLIETFILFDDAVGRDLQRTLIAAAGRGSASTSWPTATARMNCPRNSWRL